MQRNHQILVATIAVVMLAGPCLVFISGDSADAATAEPVCIDGMNISEIRQALTEQGIDVSEC